MGGVDELVRAAGSAGSDGDLERALLDGLRPALADGPGAWVRTLAAVCDRSPLPLPVLRSITSELAWASRAERHPLPPAGDAAAGAGQGALAAAYARTQRLRFDFRYADLEAEATAALAAHAGDALLLAMLGFAQLAVGNGDGLLPVEAALAAPDADGRTRHVCLQALWSTTAVPDAADRVLALSDDMLRRGEDDAVVQYRRARALRQKGDLDRAEEAVVRGLARCRPGDLALHQDLVREQEAVRQDRHVQRVADEAQARAVTAVTAEVDRRMAEARRLFEDQARKTEAAMADGLFRTVEILGLFVTLIGFLAASGFVLSRSEDFWQLLASVAVIGVGAVAFFLALRVVVHGRRPAG